MNRISIKRLIVFLLSVSIGIVLEYILIGHDAFEAIGILLLALFVGPIFLLLMLVVEH